MNLDSNEYKDYDSSPPNPFMDIRPAKWRCSCLRALIIGFIGSFALASFMITVVRIPWSSSDIGDYAWTDCDKTGAQARERGCAYVPMGRYRAPPECSFSEEIEEFHPFRDREWYLDTNLTIRADKAALETGDLPLAYAQYWHDEHCTYMLRYLAMAVAKKAKMVPALVGSLHHITHCSKEIVGGLEKAYNASFLENDNKITESELGFMGCVPIKDLAMH